MLTVVPLPRLLLMVRSPPIILTMVEEMESPSPVPPGFVVKKGLVSVAIFSSGIPGPLS